MTRQMVWALQRDDANGCHTLSKSGFGQARSLRPSELAHASVMGALCAAIAIIAVVLPHAGGLGLLGAVPMGLLAYRYRIRVLITATVAGHHRHTATGRRDGRCDHRPRRHRSDLGGPIAAETG